MNVAVFFWKLKKAHEEKYQKDKKEGEEDSHHEKGKEHHHHRHGQEKRSKKSEKHTKKSEKHTKRSEKHSKRSEKRTEKRTKKTEKCTRKLKKACDQDLTNYCPTVNNNLRDMKFCLMSKFTSISTNCQEYLLHSKKYRKEPKTGQKQESIPEAIDDSSSGSEISTDSSEMVAEIGV